MIIKVRENLELRTLIPENAEEVFGAIDKNREYLREFLPWADDAKSPETTKNTIEKWQKSLEAGTEICMGIFLDREYIGNIGIHELKSQNHSAEIGYWLAEDYQGRGIVTDCVRVIINYGFNELNLNRIYICCVSKNKKSGAIPERLGFVKEAVLQDGEYFYGVYYDKVIYGMLKRNWAK